MNTRQYVDENGRVNVRKMEADLNYYKGFYEGVKEMTTLLGDEAIEINHNININGIEERKETEDKKEMEVAVGKIEGEKAEKRYLRILGEGHTLGMHSYCHKYEEIYQSVENFAKDIKKLDRYLYKITGKHPTAFRFPGGSSNSLVSDIKPYIRWVRQQGYEYYDWNAASDDAVQIQLPASVLNQNILKDIHGQSTVIILMHDLSETVHTTESLSALIDELRKQGYELRRITEATPAIHHVSIKD